MKTVFKTIIGLCLAVTVFLGSEILVKAGLITWYEWAENKTVTFDSEDKQYGIRSEEVFDYYADDVLGAVDLHSVNVNYPKGQMVCKYSPEGKRAVYYYQETPETPAVTEPSNGHSHSYEWVTTREATATVAGEKAYKCTSCSDIQSYAEISGYLAFNEDAMKSIKNTAANDTVTIDTKMWVSFHKSVFDTLETRKDVAVTVNFKHEGKNYTTTIPAGADLTGLIDENGYCGFLNLIANFGGNEVVK